MTKAGEGYSAHSMEASIQPQPMQGIAPAVVEPAMDSELLPAVEFDTTLISDSCIPLTHCVSIVHVCPLQRSLLI